MFLHTEKILLKVFTILFKLLSAHCDNALISLSKDCVKNDDFLLFLNLLLSDICSGGNWTVCEYCFMKQKCQLQMGRAQYKNAATPFRPLGINTT